MQIEKHETGDLGLNATNRNCLFCIEQKARQFRLENRFPWFRQALTASERKKLAIRQTEHNKEQTDDGFQYCSVILLLVASSVDIQDVILLPILPKSEIWCKCGI